MSTYRDQECMNPLVKLSTTISRKNPLGPWDPFFEEILEVSGNFQNRPRMSEPISMDQEFQNL